MTKKQELSLEPDIILQYLMNKLDPTSHRRLRLDYVFQLFGFVGLYHHKDLLEEYRNIDFNPWNALQTLNCYKRLFKAALERGRPKKVEYPVTDKCTEALKPNVCRYFLQSAVDDGKEMLASGEYQFLSIFLMLCTLGLGFDTAATADFKDKCIGSEKDAAEIIESALEIVAKALTSISSGELS